MQENRIDEIIGRATQEQKTQNKEVKIVKDFLVIALDEINLALQVEYLKEVFDVLDPRDIAIIPFTPAYIKGVINIRNEIIPVLDLAVILELPEHKEECRKMVVIAHNELKIAFPFSGIIDLKAINVKELKSIQDIKKKNIDIFISEEFESGGRKTGILDIPKLYASGFIS